MTIRHFNIMPRLFHLDLIKTLAIISVVCNHLLFLYKDNGINMNFMYAINSIISFVGVPFFLLCTGSLILKKNFSNIENVKIFYCKNLISILITAELWIIIYYFYLHEFNFKTLIFNVLLLNKPIEHLWYIRMIVMYYFLMPIISYLINRKQTITIIIFAIIFIITFGYNGYMIYNDKMYPTTPGLSYSCYFIYFICGYYLSNGLLKRIKTIYIFLVFTLSFFILSYTHFKSNYFIWYDNPYLLVLSISLFEIINRTEIRKEEKFNFVEKISIMSFGIYLIHMLYIILLKDFLIYLSGIYPIEIIYYTFGIVIMTISILSIKIVNIISEKIAYILFRYKI